MALSSKSSSKSPVGERKIKASRKVESKVVVPLEQFKEKEVKVELVLEEVKEEEIKEQEVKEELAEVFEPVLEVLEVPAFNFEAGANACCEPILEEVECPPCEEEHEEQIVLEKKCVKSKPLVNEAGDFLNPLTNRYVKFGSSNFKKLLRDGVIKPIELTGL